MSNALCSLGIEGVRRMFYILSPLISRVPSVALSEKMYVSLDKQILPCYRAINEFNVSREGKREPVSNQNIWI